MSGNEKSGRKPLPVRPRTEGASLLLAWLERTGVRRARLCEAAGIDPGRLRRLLTGEGSPSLREAAALQRIAGVAPATWLAKIA